MLAAQVARITADLADLRSTFLARTSGGGDAFVGARAYRSAALNVPNAAFTAIALDAESFDSATLHSTVTNTSRITVPTAGHYEVHATLRYQAGAGNLRLVGIYRNGTQIATNWSGATALGLSVSDVVPCAANDYIEMYGYQDTGGNLALEVGGGAGGNYLTVARISD